MNRCLGVSSVALLAVASVVGISFAADRPVAPRAERARAFSRKLRFTSKGHIVAIGVKLDRDLEYTFEPIGKLDSIEAIQVTIVDRAHGNKVTKGRLELTLAGTLRTREPSLVNACNVASIDPGSLLRLRSSDETVTTRGQMEVSGTVLLLQAVHRRTDEVAEDLSMRVESVSESTDGTVKLSTVTTLAPDGLPWVAETKGTIAKGPLTLKVSLRLERQMADE